MIDPLEGVFLRMSLILKRGHKGIIDISISVGRDFGAFSFHREMPKLFD